VNAERPVLDLTRHHARYERGDITVYIGWYGDELEPCLVLLPSFRHEHARPCILPLGNAWVWDELRGDGREAAQTCAAFAAGLGLAASVSSAMRVSGLIRDHLGDLIACPPCPYEQVKQAEAIITDNTTGKQHWTEIIERV
jgi:hypothetical protein